MQQADGPGLREQHPEACCIWSLPEKQADSSSAYYLPLHSNGRQKGRVYKCNSSGLCKPESLSAVASNSKPVSAIMQGAAGEVKLADPVHSYRQHIPHLA